VGVIPPAPYHGKPLRQKTTYSTSVRRAESVPEKQPSRLETSGQPFHKLGCLQLQRHLLFDKGIHKDAGKLSLQARKELSSVAQVHPIRKRQGKMGFLQSYHLRVYFDHFYLGWAVRRRAMKQLDKAGPHTNQQDRPPSPPGQAGRREKPFPRFG